MPYKLRDNSLTHIFNPLLTNIMFKNKVPIVELYREHFQTINLIVYNKHFPAPSANKGAAKELMESNPLTISLVKDTVSDFVND